MRFHRDGGSGKSSKRAEVLLLLRLVGGAGLLRYWFEFMLERP
jgi:hypothetical protein